MSGGEFDYIQQRIHDVANELETLTDEIRLGRRTGFGHLSPETINKFYEGVKALWVAEAYIHRIDWLVSADDGEQDFHKFLKDDLANVEFLWESLQKKVMKNSGQKYKRTK